MTRFWWAFLVAPRLLLADALVLPCEGRPALAEAGDSAVSFEARRAHVLDRLEQATELQAVQARKKFADVVGIESIEPLWLVHALRVTGNADALAKVASRWKSGAPAPDRPTSRRMAFDESPTPSWNWTRIGVPPLWQEGIRGAGISVAVLDGGFDLKHPLFRQVDGWDFVANANLGADRDGHGTAAAGIVADVAAEATLYLGRVCCDDDDTLFETTVWRAVQVALRRNVRVISMSLGMKAFENPNYALWRRAGAVVLAADALWIVSAGNRPDDSVGAPASNPPPWAKGSAAADARTAVLSVGASDENDKPRPLSSAGVFPWTDIAPYFDFANGLRKPEVCAPSDVQAPRPGGGYRIFSGTSAATPHVAGIAALLWSARPEASAVTVAEAIRDGAKPIGDRCGSGRVDAEKSWVQLSGGLGRYRIGSAEERPPMHLPHPGTAKRQRTGR